MPQGFNIGQASARLTLAARNLPVAPSAINKYKSTAPHPHRNTEPCCSAVPSPYPGTGSGSSDSDALVLSVGMSPRSNTRSGCPARDLISHASATAALHVLSLARQSTLLRAHDAAGGVVWVTRVTVQAEAAGTFDLGLGLRLQLGQCLLPHAPYGRTRD